jgi:dTDP-4-dehydrorhamnose reductase
MRWLITGGGGMLAQELQKVLARDHVVAPGHAELDITDADAVNAAMAHIDVVVNTAAFTGVDAAEDDEAAATAVNATGAEVVARAAQARGARMVQLSTDYVFDGRAREPYDERTGLTPLGAYGRSKAAGETAVRAATNDDALVVRTAWLYGAGGPNFARTIMRLLREKDEVAVVTDQTGQPTWAADVAHEIADLIQVTAPGGIYHATNSGQASWFEFARAIASEAGIDPDKVVATTAAAFNRPAPRPEWSVLGHAATTRLGLPGLRPWREALHAAMNEGALED